MLRKSRQLLSIGSDLVLVKYWSNVTCWNTSPKPLQIDIMTTLIYMIVEKFSWKSLILCKYLYLKDQSVESWDCVLRCVVVVSVHCVQCSVLYA